MWFSPLKGAHLTLGQLDKTLPVDKSVTANTQIRRGSFVCITVGAAGDKPPSFKLYTSTEAAKPNAVPYIALMGINDFQAGMAGNVGQAPEVEGATPAGTLPTAGSDAAKFLGVTRTTGEQSVTGPRITAISVVQPAEYQTSAFEDVEGYYVGAPLTISDNGKLTPFEPGRNIVGYVTAGRKTRWVNDLGADAEGARISGGNVEVIEFSTAWIPVAATDSNVKAFNAGAPKAVAPAADKPAAPAADKPAAPAADKPAAPAAVKPAANPAK